jgi:hypothetical protein
MPRWPGGKAEKPYGVQFRVKGPRGPITTEKWFSNRSDRDRAMAALKGEFGDRLLWSKRIGK